MKNVFLICFFAAGVATGNLFAQVPHADKMKIFSVWIGRWKGEGYMQVGPGEPKKAFVDEQIEARLDGMVLVVEGVGRTTDTPTGQESVVHHALGVVSFDPQSGDYLFRSYLKDGRSADTRLEVLAENRYQWGFDSPRGKIRYNITLDPEQKTWTEVGEFSRDGNTWMKFFDMTLTRVDD